MCRNAPSPIWTDNNQWCVNYESWQSLGKSLFPFLCLFWYFASVIFTFSHALNFFTNQKVNLLLTMSRSTYAMGTLTSLLFVKLSALLPTVTNAFTTTLLSTIPGYYYLVEMLVFCKLHQFMTDKSLWWYTRRVRRQVDKLTEHLSIPKVFV